MFYFAGLLSRTSYESTKTLIGIDFSNTDFNRKAGDGKWVNRVNCCF